MLLGLVADKVRIAHAYRHPNHWQELVLIAWHGCIQQDSNVLTLIQAEAESLEYFWCIQFFTQSRVPDYENKKKTLIYNAMPDQ